MPWRREIVEGLLGADLVAFQTPLGAQNFIRAARRFADVSGRGNALTYDGRSVQVQAVPISIDAERFEVIARRPETQAAARQLKERIGNRRISACSDLLRPLLHL
jgi:trehalose 6-phosphate synthase